MAIWEAPQASLVGSAIRTGIAVSWSLRISRDSPVNHVDPAFERIPGRYYKEMAQVEGGRGFWWRLLALIVSAGLLSRLAHTGFRLFDKYLGDALYAAMVYVLFRL